MSKKFLVTIVLLFSMPAMVLAARTWDNGMTWGNINDYWDTPQNWAEGAAPIAADSVYIYTLDPGYDGPEFDQYVGDVTIRRFRWELPENQTTTMTMSGGSLTVQSWDIEISGILIYSDGGEILLPSGGGDNRLAKIAMTDGTINAEFLRVASGGGGQIDLFGGAVNVDILLLSDDGLIDIRNDGVLTINDSGSNLSVLNALANNIADGELVAEGGRGLLDVQVGQDIVISALTQDNDMAWAPSPAPYQQYIYYDIGEEPNLVWSPGDSAPASGDAHKIYFGDSADNLSLVSTQTKDANTYNTASLGYALALDTTYYWRVDEVGTPDVTGQVWLFTTNDYIIVDQMEDYADEAALDANWVASTNATTTLETTDPVRHTQSLKLQYLNTSSPYTSDATYTVDTSKKDFTRLDAKLLGVWFYGDAGNDVNEPFYVTLSDGVDSASVVYGDSLAVDGTPYDVNDIADPDWHTWFIDLQEFADANVDLDNVQTIAIGFGDDGAPAGSGFGTVWIDNIRLQAKQCWNDTGTGDFNGDCVIDMTDFAQMAGNWLNNGYWPQ